MVFSRNCGCNALRNWIVTQSDVKDFGDLRNVTVLHYDKLGRIRLSRQLETKVDDPATAAADESAGIKTDMKYVFTADRNETWVSNPYRNSESTAPTRGWNIKRLDKAGRACYEESFAGSGDPTVGTQTPNACTCQPSPGAVAVTAHTYEASPSWTSERVVDAAGKVRQSYQDALGRLVALVEDPDTARYHTYYSYDLLNNLTQTQQVGTCSGDPVASRCSGGQTRAFVYTSLKRLSSATSPELSNNAISYVYDPNGNLASKISPGLQATFAYDPLNRIKTRTYSDGPTPSVTYCYDGKTWDQTIGGCSGSASAPSLGHLTEVGSSVSKTSYSYNYAGQITGSTQTTANQAFPFTYKYNAAFKLASETYPTGREIATEYDDAGRPKYLKGTFGGTEKYYIGNPNPTPPLTIQYAPHGALSSLPMANGVTETWSYNSRLQPTRIQAGSLLTILNCYQSSDDASDCGLLPVQGNNGNVQRQKITRNTQTWVQNYTYDALNRLSTATETTANGWTQTYGYDPYGNRWLASGLQLSSLTPTAQNVFDAATNRLVGTNNYDLRGNQRLYDAFTLTHDGDDKLLYATSSTKATKYEYDGEGRRVRAHSCSGSSPCEPGSGTSTTVFAYDAFGKLAVEYRPESDTTGTSFYTQDHLGSTRLETNSSGVQTQCSDYLPFGEEIPSGTTYGNRTTCFGVNDNKIKFTGKERDTETGLDYFLARYYSGAQGRFLSPDEFKGGIVDPFTGQDIETNTALPYADITDPQTLNKYAYVRNNPLRYTDPDGHCTDPLTCSMEFAGIGTLIEPGGGTVVGAVVGGIVGSAVAFFAGKAIIDHIHQSSDTSKSANKSESKPATQDQSQTTTPPPPGNQNDDRHGGGKTGQKYNVDRRASAEQKLESAKKELGDIRKITNKTKEQAARVRDLEKQVKHLQRKVAKKSEVHVRTEQH
jgi:RHS repeat-associated protein